MAIASFQTSGIGFAASMLKAAGSIFGGEVSRAGWGADHLKDALRGPAWDGAFQKAIALQPAQDPAVPRALARDARARAIALRDPATLVDVLALAGWGMFEAPLVDRNEWAAELRDRALATAQLDKALDIVIQNATIIDAELGIVKADIGIRDGRIVGVGKAGNPDVMPGVHPA